MGVLGFSLRCDRPEDAFACLALGRAELMLDPWRDDPARQWETAPLERPSGRGVTFQIEVGNVDPVHVCCVAAGVAPFRPLREAWYRQGARETGQREVLVQDPDGYLLRFMQHLGTRPARARARAPAPRRARRAAARG